MNGGSNRAKGQFSDDPTFIATGIVVSVLNSTATPLGAGATFTGTGEDVSRYQEIDINAAGGPANASGTLFFEFSPDGINWDVSVPIVLTNPSSLVPQPLRVVLPYFRTRYVNDGVAQTSFRLTVVFHLFSAKHLTRFLNQSILADEPVENVRAFIGGQSPDGPFTNQPATGAVAALSSNTPLGISATFNAAGTPVSLTGYVAATVAIKSNVNSASMGLVFQFFADSAGTRLVKEARFTYSSAPDGVAIQVPTSGGNYLRVKYTNGTTAQTTFEIVTKLLISAPPGDVVAVNDVITDTTAAQVSKSQLVGRQENGIYSNVALSNSSSIKVAISDRPSEVRSRVAKYINVPRTALVAGGTVLYTVTAGYALFLSNFLFNSVNDSAVIGEWTLLDNVTTKATFILTNRVAATPASAAIAAPTLPEPMKFLTTVRVVEVTGAIDISGFLIGYEEPL